MNKARRRKQRARRRRRDWPVIEIGYHDVEVGQRLTFTGVPELRGEFRVEEKDRSWNTPYSARVVLRPVRPLTRGPIRAIGLTTYSATELTESQPGRPSCRPPIAPIDSA